MGITNRERQILDLADGGATASQIATESWACVAHTSPRSSIG